MENKKLSKEAKAMGESKQEITSSPPVDPRKTHKGDQATNTEEQNEIINEPNYKTDREEEIQNKNEELQNSTDKPKISNKEQPEAEA